MEYQSEDCLYLNIYTPKRIPRLLPVMVFIHGGSFVTGAGSVYPAEGIGSNFPANGVILVTINYRLGALGFMHLGNEVPANLGLWDQIAALQWVQENIADFGGDASEVTVFGESAGSASVSLLTYSPFVTSQRLFNRVIMQSGVGPNGWALEGNMGYPATGNSSQDFAVALGCATAADFSRGNLRGLTSCLRRKSAREIRDASMGQSWWSPALDAELLPAPLAQLAQRRNPELQVVLGTNRDEIGFFAFYDFLFGKPLSSYNEDKFEENLWEMVPSSVFGRETAAVKQRLREHYSMPRNTTDPLFWIKAYVKSGSDVMFNLGALEEAIRWYQIGAPVYVYQLDYLSEAFPWPNQYKGVIHAMELAYLFPGYGDEFNPFSKWYPDTFDTAVTVRFGKLWTNFGKTGNPNEPGAVDGVEWPRFNPSTMDYLSIDDPLMAKQGYVAEAARFWDQLFTSARK